MKAGKMIGRNGMLISVSMGMLLSLSAATAWGQQMERKTALIPVENTSYAIPQQPEDISPLLNGESIPMVMLKDASGKEFDLNKAVANKPTILIFYRGGWCPFCSRQLSGLQEIVPVLEKSGYQLIAVSTDKPEGLKQAAMKQQLSYTLLSDADMKASKLFGLAYKAPKAYWEMLPKTTGGMDTDLLLPVPSVFILDRKGVIHFEYINPDFKQRLNPELLKVVAEQIYKEL
ncbi:peroxiredoxin-like family protein [Chitinophaga polysaccharea]|uniref:peroxiredoxin-like family protein n=1 Tax=Chitinophaga polysaccharea TaxID=1293035 RepID=UPI0021B02342|nr:peroxiredoxin-like family protein [Chitinophaga polysaccharea]